MVSYFFDLPWIVWPYVLAKSFGCWTAHAPAHQSFPVLCAAQVWHRRYGL